MKKHLYGAEYIVLPSKKSCIHLLRHWMWCKFYRNNLKYCNVNSIKDRHVKENIFLCFIKTKIKYI